MATHDARGYLAWTFIFIILGILFLLRSLYSKFSSVPVDHRAPPTEWDIGLLCIRWAVACIPVRQVLAKLGVIPHRLALLLGAALSQRL